MATWKICFKHFDSSCRSRNIQHYTIRSQLPWAEPRPIHCITNIPNTSKAEDTKRKCGNPWGSTRWSTRCASFHCSILLPTERGRRGSYAGLSQQPWNSRCSTLLCWTCEETPNRKQVNCCSQRYNLVRVACNSCSCLEEGWYKGGDYPRRWQVDRWAVRFFSGFPCSLTGC